MAKKKVLLMGKAHSGKTSMRSIIFANYLARDTMRLSPTLDVEHHHVKFLGDLVLNLWDCGGQDAFYESYFERDRETIFRSVELLIYVFDIESDCPVKDFDHFAGVLEAIEENSPDARIFVLVHKMDLVAEEDREVVLEDHKGRIKDACNACGVLNFQCFGTSIWDETLYKAWSEIVTNLIPNIGVLESHLDDFCRICDADEVVLFEKATFLVISHAQAKNHNAPITAATAASPGEETNELLSLASGDHTTSATGDIIEPSLEAAQTGAANINPASNASVMSGNTSNKPSVSSVAASGHATPDEHTIDSGHITADASGTHDVVVRRHQEQKQQPLETRRNTPHFDTHRFEKISNIVKQFKLSCGKAQSQFQGMEVRNSRFSAFIDAFTLNTYIMVIVSDPGVHTEATLLNIKNARTHFERFIPRS
eukprot:CAMPEP_0198304468 /NCGR_PEP_ID=MMETSP1449-20131203/57416_1 /TAXON_ID=420275 /ORGANISM="Attheya septentrionalis, Strain CCMP2084" /LENGTH=424 /DNA_ID=CAMNT_0044006993 /DNA_START=106 /DNA_END=1380 /DNA_ORIENTATION=+